MARHVVDEGLLRVARGLYEAGFNVVPVKGKRPLVRWSSRWRPEWREVEEALGRGADGVAVVAGRVNPYGQVADLIIIDVDDPGAVERSRMLARLLEESVSWRTGPRCPRCLAEGLTGEAKQGVRCEGGRCRHELCGAEFSLGEAPRGYAAMAYVDRGALRGTRRLGPVEIMVSNYQLVPPSRHPSGARYEWLRPPQWDVGGYGVYSLSREELETLLRELEELAGTGSGGGDGGDGGCREEELRRLGEAELREIVELVKPAYQPGQRQLLALYLAGWMARARVHPADAALVIRRLHEETGDEDSLRTRLSTVPYSYRKAGCWSERLAAEVEEAAGVAPYGAGGPPSEGLVKGRGGVQELLEATLGEERALEALRRLEEILGHASPWRDSIIELLDYDRQLYAVANLRSLVLARARREDDRLVYRERVAVVAPTRVTVYRDPLGGLTRYEVVFEGRTLPRPLKLGPAPLDDIAARLKAEGLVYHRRLLEDVLSAVIQGMVRRGKAEVREEIDRPGFYLVGGRLRAVRIDWLPLGEGEGPSREEVAAALKLLSELATEWYGHAADRFATAVKWGVAAPFSYALKQRGRWLPWLMLYGASRTGKTTLGDVILAMWGLGSQHRKTGASIDTVPRLGHVLSQSTFPVLVNEPGAALAREDVVEAMKNAVDSAIVRGRYVRGSYVEIPALAPLIITSNKALPRDDALLRRFIVLRFTFNDRIPEERARAFQERVKPRLPVLRALGAWLARRILDSPEALLGAPDPLRAAGELLEEAYRWAGMEPPPWLGLEAQQEDDPYEELRQAVLDYIVERVNREYFRAVDRIEVVQGDTIRYEKPHQAPLEERIRAVAEHRLIPWLALKDSDTVVILSGLARELRRELGDLGGLRSIAELMGWSYGPVRLGGRVVKAAQAPLKALARQLQLAEEP